MVISDFCIKRPVFATVINLVLVLIGIISYNRLTVREYPKIDEPTVTVETRYPGASAEIIETQVTKPIEDSVAGIEGIEVLSSISRAELSQITIRFKISRDPDNAANDVRDRVGRIRDKLPEEVEESIVSKVEADAQPIIWLAFYSDRHSTMEISDYTDRFVKDRLQNVDGVADVRIFGERRMSMRIWLDPMKLSAYKVTPQDVEAALRRQNVEIPSGRIESQLREFTVLSETDLKTPEEFGQIIIRNDKDSFVRIKDVGRTEIAPEDVRRTTRFNGNVAVALGVIKQATANPLDVSEGVQKILPVIEESLPRGMTLNIAYDSSVFIKRSIKGVYKAIFEAVALVLVVIFIFLRSARATLIPMITVPVSLIGTFFIMYYLDFSINVLTLLALVLAIGMVVDDAIVMLENIYRYIEKGLSPYEAALKGSKEIGFAVVAMTITLAAVYAPVAFAEGTTTGRLFKEFAVTLAGAVIISGFIALTLSPMMCSKLLKNEHNEKHGRFYNIIESFFNRLIQGYSNTLVRNLEKKWRTILIGLLVASVSIFMLKLLKSELAPTEDRGTIIGIAIAPEGSTVDYTGKWMQELEKIYRTVPEVEKFFVVAGFPVVSQGISFIRLKDWEKRSRPQGRIIGDIAPGMIGLPGVFAFPISPPSLGRSVRSTALEYVIQTSGTYQQLADVATRMMEEIAKYPGIANPDSDLKLNLPQISINMDRNKAASIGVNIDDVGRTLETMLGGRKVTRFKKEGEQYDVIVQIEDEKRRNPSDLSDIYVRTNSNKMVKVSNLIQYNETVAPRELNHFNQLRAVKISASVSPGYSLGDVIKFLENKSKEVLPANAQIDFDGESREFKTSSTSLYYMFILSLCFIYLVLAAQFESFRGPLVIMLSVPLSITGALIALYISGGTLNIYSQVGIITLVGLITKHGILIVEFANQKREEGFSSVEAVREAAILRLRPILMTTASMVLGAFPLAFATGAGAESRHQIGWVIVGGMTIGTFFTLFVIPSAYVIVMSAKEKFAPKPVS